MVSSWIGSNLPYFLPLRGSRRTSDPALPRVRSNTLRLHPWRLGFETLQLLQRWCIIQQGDRNFEEYMGHDTFKIENQKLVRIFPIYGKGDTHKNPTGGLRKMIYGLYPGEVMRQLRVEKFETLNSP